MKYIKGFILYKFYYPFGCIYLGRTKQKLQDRIRGHLFAKPMHRKIDINNVIKIEYAEFETAADMNLYEVYFINLLKPSLNVDDKEKDDLTVQLPDVEWKEYKPRLWDKWLNEINRRQPEYEKNILRYKIGIKEDYTELRKKYRNNEISKEECKNQINILKEEEGKLEIKLYGRY